MTRSQIVTAGLYIYACLLLAGHIAVYGAGLISGKAFWTGLTGVPFILLAATGVLFGV